MLLDLRLKKDESRALRLLEGLYPGRAEKFWIKVKNAKKFSDNYLSAVGVAIAKGEVMKVLYEHAFILENKPEENRDEQKIQEVQNKINEILSEKKEPK